MTIDEAVTAWVQARSVLELARAKGRPIQVRINPQTRLVQVGDKQSNTAGENWIGDDFLPALLKATVRHMAMGE